MLKTRVGQRGRITLPREVRRQIKLDEGDRILFIFQGNDVLIKPITQTLLDLRGSVGVGGKQDFDSARKAIAAKCSQRDSDDQ